MSKEIVVQTDMLSSLSRDYKNYSDNIYDIYKAGKRKIERELESVLSNYSDYYSVKSRIYELQRMLAENEQEIRAVQSKGDKISIGLQKAAQSYIESEEKEKRLIASQQGKMIKLDEVNRLSKLNISINANLKNQDVNDADPALGIGYMAFDGAIEYTLDSGTKETISGMSKKTSNVKSNILGNISNTVNNVKTSIGDFIGGFKKTAVRISESMQAFWDNFKNECLKLFKKAEAVFSDFGHKARDATEYLANKAQSLAKLIAENKDAIWDGLKTVGIVILDVVQFVLDIVGLIPAVGEIADAINGCIYLLRGDMVSAGLSFAACIPFAGWAATLGKFAKRGLEFADKIGDIGKLIDRVKDFGKYFDKIKDVGNAVLKYSDNVIQLVRKKGSDVWSYLSKFNLVDKAKDLVSKVVQKGIDINSYLEKQVARLKLNLGDWWDAQYRLGIVPPETAKWLDWMDSRAGKEVGETIPDIEKTVDGVEHTGVSKVDIELGKTDLDTLRKKWNVPETDTIAVGKTDVKGLEDSTYEGGSPAVRKEAGLKDLDEIMPDRPIQAPRNNPQFTRHAEEVLINEFIADVEKAGLRPEEVIGTLYIHQSNVRGVCTACIQGISNPRVKPGIFMQLTQKYPNLIIKVTSEIDEAVKVSGKLSFTLKGGKLIE